MLARAVTLCALCLFNGVVEARASVLNPIEMRPRAEGNFEKKVAITPHAEMTCHPSGESALVSVPTVQEDILLRVEIWGGDLVEVLQRDKHFGVIFSEDCAALPSVHDRELISDMNCGSILGKCSRTTNNNRWKTANISNHPLYCSEAPIGFKFRVNFRDDNVRPFYIDSHIYRIPRGIGRSDAGSWR